MYLYHVEQLSRARKCNLSEHNSCIRVKPRLSFSRGGKKEPDGVT